MASHHHVHHQCQTTHAVKTTSCGGCCCSCSLSHHSPPPPTDPLLHAIAAHLLHPIRNHQKEQRQQQCKQKRFQKQQRQEGYIALASLSSRIEALEISLSHFSASSYSPTTCSLRDVAARTIQTHFRSFLARRSRALRQLKDLAFIKSSFHNLKSSVSGEKNFNPHAVSRKAMDLLVKIDAIQGCDPMIRDGKRSISRELVCFIEFIDGISVKRHQLLSKCVKNMRLSRYVSNKPRASDGSRCHSKRSNECPHFSEYPRILSNQFEENEEEDVDLEAFHQASSNDDDDEENPRILFNLKEANAVTSQFGNGSLVERKGLQSKVRKRVSFVDNGTASRVLRSNNAASVKGSVSIDDITDNTSVENDDDVDDDDDEEAHLGDRGSPEDSDAERNSRENLKPKANFENYRRHHQGQNVDVAFSPPLPVKMESRADLMNKRSH